MWKIDPHLVEEWLVQLDGASYDLVVAALDVLRREGPSLGRPLVDRVTGSRHHNMKELRPGSAGDSELRVLFVFDPVRTAVLLIAGNKARSWNRWYQKHIPIADDLYDDHLAELERRK